MEALGTVASIIAVLQLSETVIKYIVTAKGAKDDRKRLREEIRGCSNILKQLQDNADDSEEGKAWSDTIKALEAPDAPLGRLYRTLSLVQTKIQTRDGITKILKWPFQEKEVQKMIQSIEREKTLLDIALQNNSRKLLQEITKSSKENGRLLVELAELLKESQLDNESQFTELNVKVSETLQGIDNLREQQDHQQTAEERKAMLNWLSTADYTTQQQDLINDRQPGTGQWVLESKVYRTWMQAEGQTLFCPGIPGAGKTFITSTVIENLSTKYQDDTTVTVVYLYCNFKRKDEQNLYHLLASLLRQLIESQETLHMVARDLHKKHQKKQSRLSLEEISRGIQSVAASYSKVYILVDAFDECQTVDGCRSKLISELFSLQKRCVINLFATSRDIPEIAQRFEGVEMLRIFASSEDVQMYLDGRMDEVSGYKESLREEIKAEIIESVQGMFLLAKLHLDSLIGMRSPKAVRTALKKLPTGSDAYDYAYKDAMDRIEGQRKDQKELAKQVLSWITCAERPLTTSEIQHALAVEIGEPELDEENFSQVEDMVSVCAGLVTVDKEGDIIRLAHYTTQEYFERTQMHWFPNAHGEITAVCITYLLFDDFQSGPCLNEWTLADRLQIHKLYEYAASHWGYHARVTPAKRRQAMELLESPKKMKAAFQVRTTFERDFMHPMDDIRNFKSTALHFAAYYGLEEEVAACLEKDSNINAEDAEDPYQRTPLSYAAECGHETIVELLLDNGASLESSSRNVATPLYYAACNGHETIVLLLLRNGADPNVAGRANWGTSPLCYAAGKGHEAVVQALLEFNADVNMRNSYAQTPLIIAVREGHEVIVKLLLPRGIDADSEDLAERTALSYAAQGGHEAIAMMLIEHGADIHSKDTRGQSPLMYAAELGHESIVKMLHSKGADAFSKDHDGKTALFYATSNGHESIVRFLLDSGVDVNSRTSSNETPLIFAAQGGHEAVAKLLVEKGANVKLRDKDGYTPLLCAFLNRFDEVTKLLLDGDVNIDLEEVDWPLLMDLAGGGDEAMVKLLMGDGAKANWRALLRVVTHKYDGIVSLLLDHGASMDILPIGIEATITHIAEENIRRHQELGGGIA